MSYLKPSETLSELFAGLVVVLTVTLAASVLGGGDEVSAKIALIGAIGANIAWGVIDAALYLMNTTSTASGNSASYTRSPLIPMRRLRWAGFAANWIPFLNR